MKRFTTTLTAWLVTLCLVSGWNNSLFSQPQGTNYEGGAGGGVTIEGVVGTGGFSPRIKGGAGLVVNAVDLTAHLNSIDGITGNRDVILIETKSDGSQTWTFQFHRPGQDLDPGAVCEATPADGYGFVAFDLNNLRSYVVFVDPGGSLKWVTEIKDVIAKDIFLVLDGANGGPEFVVVGELTDQTYIGHFEMGSGNPTLEYFMPSVTGGPLNIGYCGIDHEVAGNRQYKVVTTDSKDHLYVHCFKENGGYLGTTENFFTATQSICPYRIKVLEPTQELLIVGTAEAWGTGAYYGFVSLADPTGQILWTNYLSIGMSGPRSAFEDVVWDPWSNRIHTVGYVTDPGSGNRMSIMVNWKRNRNQDGWNYYFPTSSSPVGSDDILAGVDVLNTIDYVAMGGFVREPSVGFDGLSTCFVTDPIGGTNCWWPTGSPWDAMNSTPSAVNFPMTQLNQASPDGIISFDNILNELSCGTPKWRGFSEEAPQTRLDVYPQPARNHLVVEVEDEELRQIQVFGLDGRLVKTETFGQALSHFVMDLHQLSPGFYLLKVEGAHQTWQQKIVVQ